MKKKLDFITNSSSTAFIIASLKKAEVEELKIDFKISYDLMKLVRRKLKTVEELQEYFDEYYYDWLNDEDISELFNKQKEIIEKGGEIYLLRAYSDSEDPIEVYLYESEFKDVKLPDNFILIEGGN